MKHSLIYLLLAAVLIGTTIMLTACGQEDNVIKPQLATTITLTPERLPKLQDIYVYELWGATVNGSDTSFTSIFQFDWDPDLFVFRDTAGNAISNSYSLPDTWLDYTHILLSIENRGIPHSDPSGTYMLIVETGPVNPTNPNFIMEFPVSMFLVTGSWFVGTPTDDTLDTTNEEKGIWV